MLQIEQILKNTGLFWQYPVITEQTFYEQNKNNSNYIGFPWATIIDKNINTSEIFKILIPFIKKNVEYYTCCQHISFRKLFKLFKLLNIKTVYSPHKIKTESKIIEIFIKPCPLYAVNIEDKNKNLFFLDKDYMNIERDLLYSFQGAYNPRWYMTDIRKKIFQMKHPENTFIKDIGNWHFDNVVYSNKQNSRKEMNIDNKHLNNTYEYNSLLLRSRFSLCPSGSGPNSIRFWESLAVGSIPILLSDSLELPYHNLWKDTIIELNENELETLPKVLKSIDENKEHDMRKNCIKLYNYFKNNFANSENIKKHQYVIHYCCGSYFKGCFGGVARYDYHISLAFPDYIHFTAPQEKQKLLLFLKEYPSSIVITDNHLSCDIPNDYNIILVHHGVAKTHAIREPTWNKYWKDLCCNGQEKMLKFRDPKKTKIISISNFCTDEFKKYYEDVYENFEKTTILHTSELNTNTYKTQWNNVPVILGNWACENKGKNIIQKLKNNNYIFKTLKIQSNGTHPNDILNFNQMKQEIYLKSDIFLQLSLCEGNSYATLDALLCGIPVVSTNTGLFYSNVPDNCFVKIIWERRNDVDYVKSKIDYAWKNRETIGINGRKWFLENCELNNWINIMKNFIKNQMKIIL